MVKGGSDGSDGGQVIIDEPTTPPSFPRAQFKPSSTGYRTCFARPRVGSTWPRPRVVWFCSGINNRLHESTREVIEEL